MDSITVDIINKLEKMFKVGPDIYGSEMFQNSFEIINLIVHVFRSWIFL